MGYNTSTPHQTQKGLKRKEGVQCCTCQQVFHPAMVPDPLHDIPGHPNVEEGNGQVHQLDKKIRYQGYINPGIEIEQNPTPKNLNARPSKKTTSPVLSESPALEARL